MMVDHRTGPHRGLKQSRNAVFALALRTDGRTDQPTDRPTDGRTDPLIEMRGRI